MDCSRVVQEHMSVGKVLPQREAMVVIRWCVRNKKPIHSPERHL